MVPPSKNVSLSMNEDATYPPFRSPETGVAVLLPLSSFRRSPSSYPLRQQLSHKPNPDPKHTTFLTRFNAFWSLLLTSFNPYGSLIMTESNTTICFSCQRHDILFPISQPTTPNHPQKLRDNSRPTQRIKDLLPLLRHPLPKLL